MCTCILNNEPLEPKRDQTEKSSFDESVQATFTVPQMYCRHFISKILVCQRESQKSVKTITDFH